ncbi:MAG: GNAT family N-acetyltransferase [Leptolyngbya sp.]|nr:GNAT family N-acetyltransferase [Candidatus Melainabacteria bacterium]
MIKIEPLFAIDTAQTRALLRHQNEPMPFESFCAEDALALRGFTFFQHWLPCNLHFAPMAYIAKEDGIVLGLISISSVGKSRSCWRVEHLVVHPNHRGRGIAQELLRFAFATFASQGAAHFVAEVADQNSVALSLLGSTGFRRCYRVTHYQVPVDYEPPGSHDSEESSGFRLAIPSDRQALYQLFQECLPPDLRITYEYVPDDFLVNVVPTENISKLCRKLIKQRIWYWVSQDPERKSITSAIRVLAHREGDYHLEFAVHPGWAHTSENTIFFVLNIMKRLNMRGVISIKGFDYQPHVVKALEGLGLERTGTFSLLARDHWVRAKQKRVAKKEVPISLTSIAQPGISLPLPAERTLFPPL